MTVYEIPNIEHCDVTAVGTIAYRIVAHSGWYIYQPENDPSTAEEENKKYYSTVAILRTDYDFSKIEITAEADLPENAEICGGDNEPEHEIM